MGIHLLNKRYEKSAAKLLKEATSTFSNQKKSRHELWILTCYVDFDLIEKYVDFLSESIRLTDVFLAFDFSEIYKLGPKETERKLRMIEASLLDKDINFEWRALAASKLVHSKGYALFQRREGEVSDGVVLTTSANFTVPGFKGQNIELGYISSKKTDLRQFESIYNELWDDVGKGVKDAIAAQEGYLFKFSLLSHGVFIHKWSDGLRQRIGIKYKLTTLGKEGTEITQELKDVGFEPGESFTRQALNITALPEKEVSASFVKRFTIETYWGKWCPLDAWNALSETFEGADEFIEQFNQVTEDTALDKVLIEAEQVQERLIRLGLIERVDSRHLRKWSDRIKELRTDHRRLERIFTGYDAHEMPYTVEQKQDVKELFDNLCEAIDLSKSTNIAKKKVISALESSSLKELSLSKDELLMIKEMAK